MDVSSVYLLGVFSAEGCAVSPGTYYSIILRSLQGMPQNTANQRWQFLCLPCREMLVRLHNKSHAFSLLVMHNNKSHFFHRFPCSGAPFYGIIIISIPGGTRCTKRLPHPQPPPRRGGGFQRGLRPRTPLCGGFAPTPPCGLRPKPLRASPQVPAGFAQHPLSCRKRMRNGRQSYDKLDHDRRR